MGLQVIIIKNIAWQHDLNNPLPNNKFKCFEHMSPLTKTKDKGKDRSKGKNQDRKRSNYKNLKETV